MICKLRGHTSTCFISLVQFLFKQAHSVSQKIDWVGDVQKLRLRCEHLYLSFWSLMQLEFYEVSQRYYELEKNYPHLTDEWTKHRGVSGCGGSSELQQTQSVERGCQPCLPTCHPLRCSAEPQQKLFSQTDRFQTFYKLFAFFFFHKVICIHQVQIR